MEISREKEEEKYLFISLLYYKINDKMLKQNLEA